METIQSYLNDSKNPTEAEEILTVIAYAMDVFGSPAIAMGWLLKPREMWSKESPMHLLDTKEGRERVITILGQIEHGIYT